MGSNGDDGLAVDLAEYLFTRVYQIGVRSLHGVPSDFNLPALDYVEPAGLHWVGNANELNAGYAADGYARIKGVAALVTGFGVGELSAVNAIGGSYAEKVPVIHIVGMPTTSAQDGGAILHHSLGNGDLRFTWRIYQEVTCAQANLRDASTAPSLIDETLRQCILQSLPVYIQLPLDLVNVKVSASRLAEPIPISPSPNDKLVENAAVDDILRLMECAKQPALVVDGWTETFGASEEVNTLARATGFPTFTTLFGRSIIDDSYPNFYGVYSGSGGDAAIASWMQSCDLVIRLAPLNSDYNTAFFRGLTKPSVTVEIRTDAVSVLGEERYKNLHIKSLLRKLVTRLGSITTTDNYGNLKTLANPPPKKDASQEKEEISPDDKLRQDTFWKYICRYFKPGDTVMTETGTSDIGASDFVMPRLTRLISSAIWLSIGYALGSCAGVARAKRDIQQEGGLSRPSRTILFEGDGSLQMTVQSISDIIRNRLDVTIFVINNDGYTIERAIHGMTAGYNWIQPWRYLEAARFFGAPENDPDYPVFTGRATTWAELADVLSNEHIQAGKGLNIVEVLLHEHDMPGILRQTVESNWYAASN